MLTVAKCAICFHCLLRASWRRCVCVCIELGQQGRCVAAECWLLTRQYMDFFFSLFRFVLAPTFANRFEHMYAFLLCLLLAGCEIYAGAASNQWFFVDKQNENWYEANEKMRRERERLELNIHYVMETRTHLRLPRSLLSFLIQPQFFLPYDWIFSFHICSVGIHQNCQAFEWVLHTCDSFMCVSPSSISNASKQKRKKSNRICAPAKMNFQRRRRPHRDGSNSTEKCSSITDSTVLSAAASSFPNSHVPI